MVSPKIKKKKIENIIGGYITIKRYPLIVIHVSKVRREKKKKYNFGALVPEKLLSVVVVGSVCVCVFVVNLWR